MQFKMSMFLTLDSIMLSLSGNGTAMLSLYGNGTALYSNSRE